MIFKSTDEFYHRLASDYRDKAGTDKDIEFARKRDGNDGCDDTDKKVRQSFLYIYFKGKKNIDARRISRDKDLLFEYRAPKKDKYTLLRGAYMAFEEGIISDKDYREIFLEVNACSKSGQKKREKLFDANPGEAREQLEDRLLRDCAERFIDNALRRQNNSNIDVIEMLSKYSTAFDAKGNDVSEFLAGAARADLSGEYIQKCAELYEIILSGNEMADVIVPLYIDKDSGAGVYIIGKKILGGDSAKVCILSFDDIGMDFTDAAADETSIINVLMRCMKYNSVEEAFEKFAIDVSNGVYFDGYYYYNVGLPNGADNCFKLRFFDCEEEARKEEADIKKWKENGGEFVL